MAAGEDELEALGRKRRRVHRFLRAIVCGEQVGLGGERAFATEAVHGSVSSRRHQPGARIARHAVSGPAIGGDGERLLRGFLGQVKVAEETDQGGQDAGPFFAEDLVEGRYQYTSEGRISTAPP